MKFRSTLIAALAAACLTLTSIAVPAEAAQAAQLSIPKAGKKTFALEPCELAEQLDCIQSFTATIDGVVYTPTYLGLSSAEPRVDDLRNIRDDRTSSWEFDVNGQILREDLSLALQQVNTVLGFRDKTKMTAAELFGRLVFSNPEDLGLYQLPEQAIFKLVVRTSWLQAENVTSHMRGSSFVERKIKGGRVWTLEGQRATTAMYTSNVDKKMKSNAVADLVASSWDFHIHHAAGETSSFFGSRCAKYGYSVQSNNAAGGGVPFWNDEKQALDFSIEAAHRLTDGSLNRGFFYLKVNRAYMRCAYPNSGLHRANSFSVQVLNENGTKQVATTTVSYKAGVLRVAAENFHYSSPTIRLKPKK